MALETFPYDTAEFIKTPEDVFYYLEAEMEQNEPPYWAGAISIVARARGGFDNLAEETSLPVERLQLAANKSATPDRAMMVAVMEAYRPKDSSASRVA